MATYINVAEATYLCKPTSRARSEPRGVGPPARFVNAESRSLRVRSCGRIRFPARRGGTRPSPDLGVFLRRRRPQRRTTGIGTRHARRRDSYSRSDRADEQIVVGDARTRGITLGRGDEGQALLAERADAHEQSWMKKSVPKFRFATVLDGGSATLFAFGNCVGKSETRCSRNARVRRVSGCHQPSRSRGVFPGITRTLAPPTNRAHPWRRPVLMQSMPEADTRPSAPPNRAFLPPRNIPASHAA